MNYILKAALISMQSGSDEICRFEYTIDINDLKYVGDLGKPASATIFQVDIQNIYLDLPKRLKKATDFIRRANYVNDWAEVEVDNHGVAKEIGNVKELATSWKEIRRKLTADYKGEQVDNYLREIDERFETGGIQKSVITYLNFGLLFPSIPSAHKAEWRHRRQIIFSEYDKYPVEEHVLYMGEHENMRQYNVSWSVLPEHPDISINSGEGYYIIPRGEIFPNEAKMEIAYQCDGSVKNKWSFKLEKY